jgi:hypothetical protein
MCSGTFKKSNAQTPNDAAGDVKSSAMPRYSQLMLANRKGKLILVDGASMSHPQQNRTIHQYASSHFPIRTIHTVPTQGLTANPRLFDAVVTIPDACGWKMYHQGSVIFDCHENRKWIDAFDAIATDKTQQSECGDEFVAVVTLESMEKTPLTCQTASSVSAIKSRMRKYRVVVNTDTDNI